MSSEPIEITSVALWNQNLREATASGRSLVVDFHATWCGPCKQIAPVFTQLAAKTPQTGFLRVDVDGVKAIAEKYQISAMPTFLVIKAGKVVETLKGADPNGLRRIVQTHAGPNPPIKPLPADAEKAKEEGNAFFKSGAYSDAVNKYTDALEIVPDSAVLLTNRAFAHLKLSNAASAISDSRRATELDPAFVKAWLRLGDGLVLSKEGDWRTEAREAYLAGEKRLSETGSSVMKKEIENKLLALK